MRPAQILAFLLLVTPASKPAFAEDPTPKHAVASKQLVLEVTDSSNPVFHGLEVQAGIDKERRWVSLRGPKLVSMPDKETDQPVFLNWYAIRKPESEPTKMLTIKDGFSGEQQFRVSAGAPAFFVMPSQRLANGPPAGVPETLNLFIAFEIADPESLELPEPVPGKPRYLCLPAEEWHHEEHFEIKDKTACLMVYESVGSMGMPRMTTIDQFGLNKLTVSEPKWICVPARLVP